MGFIHDRIAEAGHEVDFICADHLSAGWNRALSQRLVSPLKVRHHAVLAARSGRPYNIIDIHGPTPPSLRQRATPLDRRSSSSPAMD